MDLGELKEEWKAVVSFIETVTYHLSAWNERFWDDLNTMVATYATDLATTEDICPTVAAVSLVQETTGAHAECLQTPNRRCPPTTFNRLH